MRAVRQEAMQTSGLERYTPNPMWGIVRLESGRGRASVNEIEGIFFLEMGKLMELIFWDKGW